MSPIKNFECTFGEMEKKSCYFEVELLKVIQYLVQYVFILITLFIWRIFKIMYNVAKLNLKKEVLWKIVRDKIWRQVHVTWVDWVEESTFIIILEVVCELCFCFFVSKLFIDWMKERLNISFTMDSLEIDAHFLRDPNYEQTRMIPKICESCKS